MIVFINDKFCNDNEATISPFDRSFLYGDGLFETIRCYQGKPFLLQKHLKRLYNGLKMLSIKIKYTKSDFQDIISQLINTNNLQNKDAYLRITVTRGVTKSLRDFSSFNPNLFITLKPLELELFEKQRKKGLKLKTVNFFRSFLPELKHTSYLPSVYGLLKNKGADDVIFTDCAGNLLETAVANIYFMKKNTVFTSGKKILKGVIREFFIKTLRKYQIEIIEENVNKKELENFESVFITNSIIELMPVKKIDGKVFDISHGLKLYELLKKEIDKKVSP